MGRPHFANEANNAAPHLMFGAWTKQRKITLQFAGPFHDFLYRTSGEFLSRHGSDVKFTTCMSCTWLLYA